MFSKMKMSTKVMLGVLLVVVLAGAGFGLWAWKAGKLKSSADTLPPRTMFFGQATIGGITSQGIPNIKMRIYNREDTTLQEPTTCMQKGPGICREIGYFTFSLIPGLKYSIDTNPAAIFQYNNKLYVVQGMLIYADATGTIRDAYTDAVLASRSKPLILTFKEVPPAKITGNVIYQYWPTKTTGALAGVKVSIRSNITVIPLVGPSSVLTDAKGNYTFDNLIPGTYHVSVDDEIFNSSQCYEKIASAIDIDAPGGRTTAWVNFLYETGSLITGKITDKDTSLPIEGVNVAAMYLHYPPLSNKTAKTAQDGSYNLCQAMYEDVVVDVSLTKDGYQNVNTAFDLGLMPVREKNFTMSKNN